MIQVKGNYVYLGIGGHWYVYDRSKEPLGAGAMGVVYYGIECSTNTPVAIKQVKEEYSNDMNIRNRARQEATLMFSHPNLVEMVGLCESSPYDGPIYIVSKYVHGDTFDNFVKDKLNGMTKEKRIKTICDTVMPVFDALDYLHSKGILHMDIKPSNIMMENYRNIRLMDLGIAYTEAYQSANKSGMMGTPKYAAPEQFGALGTRETVDTRTDIYELGVTIYELLCMENPFLSNTFAELVEKHKNMVLPYNPSIPHEITDVLRKAAHPQKNFRYSTIAEFKHAFNGAVNKWWMEKLAPPATSSKKVLIFIFLVIFVITLVSLITLILVL